MMADVGYNNRDIITVCGYVGFDRRHYGVGDNVSRSYGWY